MDRRQNLDHNHHARSRRRASQDAQASPLETGPRTIERQTKAERQTQAGGVQRSDEEELCLHGVDSVGHNKVTLYLTSLSEGFQRKGPHLLQLLTVLISWHFLFSRNNRSSQVTVGRRRPASETQSTHVPCYSLATIPSLQPPQSCPVH